MMMLLEKIVMMMMFLAYPDEDGQYEVDDSIADNDGYWH